MVVAIASANSRSYARGPMDRHLFKYPACTFLTTLALSRSAWGVKSSWFEGRRSIQDGSRLPQLQSLKLSIGRFRSSKPKSVD
jgi:hypothetical protein